MKGNRLKSQCPICGNSLTRSFQARVLGKYEVAYFHCSGCGFLNTEDPYWLEEAYSEAIALTDTGLVQRNIVTARQLATLLYFCFDRDGAYLDVAGGYGMLVRLMRDHGFDYFWDDKYCPNLMARGFAADAAKRPFSALTAFEILEHVPDPMEFLNELINTHRARTIIFSTVLYGGTSPPPPSWWYYAFESGQHISFYQHRTWQAIAERLGLHFISLNRLHMLTDRRPSPLLMQAASGKLAGPLSLYVRRQMGSKAQADHRLMIEQIQTR